jgi:hypothetical protein
VIATAILLKVEAAVELPVEAIELLGRTSVAVVVTSGPDGPQVTQSPFDWDGSLFRIEGVAWSARSDNIRRLPGVALLIRDPLSSAGLVVYGEAMLQEGEAGAGESERVVITVRPARTLWLPEIGRSAP